MDRSTNHANVILNSERFQKLFLQIDMATLFIPTQFADKITNLISNYMLLPF